MNSKSAAFAEIKLIACLAGVFILSLQGCTSPREQKEKELGQTIQTIQAPVIIAKTSSISDNYEASGTVASKVSANISSKVIGVVKTVSFEAGDSVVAGKLLVEIDQAETLANLRRSKSKLLEARKELEEVESDTKVAQFARTSAESRKTLEDQTFRRYKELMDRQSISPQEFDDASSKSKTATAELEKAEQAVKSAQAHREVILAKIDESEAGVSEAQSQLGYLLIRAPFSGLVTQKSANAGDLAAPGTVLLKLEKEDYRLEVPIDESVIPQVALGEHVPVSLGSKQLQSTVAEIVPKADPQSRSFTVKLDLPDHCGARSGMYGKASFPIGQRQSLTVPAKCLLETGQLSYVFVLDDANLARMQVVKTGRVDGEKVEILSGLSSGDRIVSIRVPALTEGMKVESRNE
ncbi:MAG: efflux RND transporter periplasmic adaptor subunit [Cyanobacteria bacterium REEB67]|nr:efflux RND transporter periplasmic adaptor subunit [Cyanobacteria bacterium REEB67]